MGQTLDLRYASMSRRRALSFGATGVLGMAGAALIGCSSNGGDSAPKSGGAAVAPRDAAASAGKPKAGGTLKYAAQKDPDSLDPYRLANAVGGTIFAANVYSRLFTFEPGNGTGATGKVVGDLVKTWEFADPTTLVLHLDPAAKFDEKEPLNGRTVTSEDVMVNWARFAKEAGNRAGLVNTVNPDAPIDKLEAVDAQTVRIKLAFPDPTVVPLLAAEPFIEPAEGIAGKIDLAKEARGTGPFLFESYKPSVSLVYKRNPKWFHGNGERPYIDGVNIPIIPDQAQFEAQFRAKNLHFAAISRTNIPQFAKEMQGTEVAVGVPNTQSPALSMSFMPDHPWHDVRIRRAVSMAIDRDQLAEVIQNPKQFEPLGVKLGVRWNAPIAGGYGAYWLDPKSDKFGPSAQYLKRNVAEATKMLAAAGYSSSKPFEFDNVYAGVYYGTDWPSRAETLQSMVRDAGVKMNLVSVDYATEYIPKYFRSKAKFEGRNVKPAVHFPPGGSQSDPLLYYFRFLGANGVASLVGDKFPEQDEMMRKQRNITKFEDRVQGLHDLQRWSTDNMIVIPVGPDTETVDLVWKGLRGPQQFLPWTNGEKPGLSANTYLFPNYWFQEQM